MKITWECIHEPFGHVLTATVEIAGFPSPVVRAPMGQLDGLKPGTQRLILEVAVQRLQNTIDWNTP